MEPAAYIDGYITVSGDKIAIDFGELKLDGLATLYQMGGDTEINIRPDSWTDAAAHAARAIYDYLPQIRRVEHPAYRLVVTLERGASPRRMVESLIGLFGHVGLVLETSKTPNMGTLAAHAQHLPSLGWT